MSFADKQ